MPILKNNDFGNDDDSTRGDRLLLMQTNIDLHAVTLGLSAPLVNWAHTCNDGWVDVCANAAMEDGQTDEAYQEFHKKFNECRDYYQDVKDVLMAIIHDLENPDEAEEAYGIRGRTPRTRHKLFASIEQWSNQHAVFVGEADPRVVPDALITNMAALADEMNAFWTVASTEKREASTAYRIKQELFAEDTDRLRVIYNIAKLIWHDDHENLKDLGFVPVTEIWTPGMPEPGLPKYPEPVAELIAWINQLELITIDWAYGEVKDITFNIYRAEGKINDPAPERPQTPWQTGVTGGSFTDPHPTNNRKHCYWVVAVKDGVEGEFADAVFVDFKPGVGPEPIEP